MARFRLHQRVQKEGETFDMFLKDLRLLAMDCQFDNPDDILTDAIIHGARHKKVQERLLNEGQELSLPKAVQIARQFELSQQQLREMRGEDSAIASIKQKESYKQAAMSSRSTARTDKKQRPPSNSIPFSPTCDRCGYDNTHKKSRGKCPAIGTEKESLADRMQSQAGARDLHSGPSEPREHLGVLRQRGK